MLVGPSQLELKLNIVMAISLFAMKQEVGFFLRVEPLFLAEWITTCRNSALKKF